MSTVLFPFVILAGVLLVLTSAWPTFWTPRELPFDEDDATRGDWQQIPSQGSPPRDGE